MLSQSDTVFGKTMVGLPVTEKDIANCLWRKLWVKQFIEAFFWRCCVVTYTTAILHGITRNSRLLLCIPLINIQWIYSYISSNLWQQFLQMALLLITVSRSLCTTLWISTLWFYKFWMISTVQSSVFDLSRDGIQIQNLPDTKQYGYHRLHRDCPPSKAKAHICSIDGKYGTQTSSVLRYANIKTH